MVELALKIIPKLSIEEGRAFLSISHKGCGSGCNYCYISDPLGPQQLHEPAEIAALCDELIYSPTFKPGREGTLISLTPETEPFKTVASTSLIIQIVRTLAALGNPLQVSTKEIVPPEVYDWIDEASAYRGQVTIFTSMASLSLSERIEPYAPKANTRFGLPPVPKTPS